jgi:hypothetical protein
MLITKRSRWSGKVNTREIPVVEAQLKAWRSGELIQVAMPNLSPDDREFIKTGYTPEDWAEMFPAEND